jgi:biotin carboxyl carrier protein
MRLHVEQAGRIRQVTVAAGEALDTVEVRLDGRVIRCEVREHAPGQLSLRLADGSMHDIVVETESAPGHQTVHVQGRRVPLVVSTRAPRAGQSAAAGTNGPIRVLAPMPGKVVRIPVQVGDVVDARQPVIVIEAMKMENALTAGRAGTVREVLVQEGASVEAGRPLVIVE